MKAKQKVLLIILDGLGAAPKGKGNAVTLANPVNLSSLWSTHPHTYLLASGESVGLPKNVKGNSEVGHLNLGAGRTVNQSFPRINKAIEKGLLYQNNALQESLRHAQKNKSKVHLIGLLSDGTVHSHINHFKAILDFFVKNNLENELYIHAFTDGRDTPTDEALKHLADMDKYCMDKGVGKIGTIIGRYFAMDRNKKWDRTEKAYYLLTQNIGTKYDNYQQAIQASYEKGVTDEFIEPIVINESKIEANDTVIFVNFRSDRATQLTQAFIDKEFQGFQRGVLSNLFLTSMTEYKKGFPEHVIFRRQYINLPLGKVIDSVGLRQLRIAETEKYPHVTYFFNGGFPIMYSKEDRVLIPSPNVPTYDLQPEMSTPKLIDILLQRIDSDVYDFILLNLANTDMVGHTGNLEACIKAVQVVDQAVKELVNRFTAKGGAVIITADHGNVEEVINLETGAMDTEHSLNPVPLIITGTKIPARILPYGSLKDVAPTVLDLMGITKPSDMTGSSLIKRV